MNAINVLSNSEIKPSPIIIALDYDNKDRAIEFVDSIDPQDCSLKVGKEMFTLFGPSLVRDLQERNFKVFLDLKFHDIPHTTARAVQAAAEMGVWMVNVHASGGARMMNAAKEALQSYGQQAPQLIAVTVLTSMESRDLSEVGINVSPAAQVQRLAKLAYDCALDGVVCSAQEALELKQCYGAAFKLVTPGVRIEGSGQRDDQRRVVTPVQAVTAGADYMVIGRPITQSSNPAEKLREIRASLSGQW